MTNLSSIVSKCNYLRSVQRNSCKSTYMKIYKREVATYEGDGKTTVNILNRETENGLMIDSYSQVGFRLNNNLMIFGPMAIFPRSVLSWNVFGLRDINEDSLSLFTILNPKIDIIVLGVGSEPPSTEFTKRIMMFMRTKRINVEILNTEQACATFNFLNVEGRCVAGALIPPNVFSVSDNDIVQSRIRNKILYGIDKD